MHGITWPPSASHCYQANFSGGLARRLLKINLASVFLFVLGRSSLASVWLTRRIPSWPKRHLQGFTKAGQHIDPVIHKLRRPTRAQIVLPLHVVCNPNVSASHK
ncbi:hypothetical protein AOQ84DRAFT_161733 [Glonium stellatum]|uniref:Uncharacterized protein n=1 Tax=Glonium stellatum TaxID=574774 RepID=A0A8E2ERL5_9PEZI|nr:hypothetical protein AOQ84DRAFT_161733 [Glonium stellatum]